MEDLRENIRHSFFLYGWGTQICIFCFVLFFCFFISYKDSFIVPEVRIVFYKMHSDFEILQI